MIERKKWNTQLEMIKKRRPSLVLYARHLTDRQLPFKLLITNNKLCIVNIVLVILIINQVYDSVPLSLQISDSWYVFLWLCSDTWTVHQARAGPGREVVTGVMPVSQASGSEGRPGQNLLHVSSPQPIHWPVTVTGCQQGAEADNIASISSEES